MKLILGLGNPGSTYEGTRHNLGFFAVEALARAEKGTWKTDTKRKADVCVIQIGEEKILLAKPATFMNLSGDAAAALLSFYKLSPADILIVHDEMDLEPLRLQFKANGGTAGHNGLASIVERLGTEAVARLRIGIGRPSTPNIPNDGYVLGKLSPENTPNALDIIAAMRDWIEGGTDHAMQRWNKQSSS
ncbi:MAG: aminoacyl-tRNA hydrolase [Candidatus Parcubacteria bacterium]|jgi:PTH1 family peptidyl-tRNA hydrolase